MSNEDYTLLFGAITALATLAVPIVVAVMAGRFNRQLKRWEASQWRNQELIKKRLEYYDSVVPSINEMMCYFTFIGPWKEFTPPEVIRRKRELDRDFYCAAPLFGDDVQSAYHDFVGLCFVTYGAWGADARLRTGFGRRKEAMGVEWRDEWEPMFAYAPPHPIPVGEILAIKRAYNRLISAFATDIELHAPQRKHVSEDAQDNAY